MFYYIYTYKYIGTYMLLQKLNQKTRSMLRKDDDLRLAIAKANNVKISSVDRWLNEESKLLTTATNLSLMAAKFKCEVSELLETVTPETAAA